LPWSVCWLSIAPPIDSLSSVPRSRKREAATRSPVQVPPPSRFGRSHAKYAIFAAHGCASARVDSRAPIVDGVLIAGHALTAINLSRRGEAGQTQRSLGRAFGILGSVTSDEPSPSPAGGAQGFLQRGIAVVAIAPLCQGLDSGEKVDERLRLGGA